MDHFHSKDRSLGELLYYDISEVRNKGLRKGLREYRLLLTLLKSAFHYFQNQDFERFDSLVGENACQIRAIKIAIIALHNQIDPTALSERIDYIHNILDGLLTESTMSALMRSNVTMRDLLEKEGLNILLTPHEMFVFQSFLLTEMKEPQPAIMLNVCRSDVSAPKNLKKFDPAISSTFTYCIASKMRRLISEASVHFIRKMAWESKDLHLMKMVSTEFTKEHNTWPCTPMFWTYKILLHIAQQQSIPLIIHAKFINKVGVEYTIRDEDVLFFKPSTYKKKQAYIQADPNEIDLARPACVIEGIVCLDSYQCFCKMRWREKLLKHSIVDVVLAGAADHRQYPDPLIAIPIYDAEYENYKSIARDQGFSIDNPTTFFINHVYPKQVGKIIPFLSRNANLLVNS